MDHLDLTMIAKENGKTESALDAISGEMFGKESILRALMPKAADHTNRGSIFPLRMGEVHNGGRKGHTYFYSKTLLYF